MRTILVLLAAGALVGCSGGSGTPSSLVKGSSGSASAFGAMPLGVSGSGGASEELLGTDILTPLLGSGGLVGATLGGGSDGPLAGNLPAESPIPEGTLSPLTDALDMIATSVPQLGVSGDGGLGQDLLGHDITGMLLGTKDGAVPVLLAGGNDAPLGSLAPEDAAPLAPVGDLLANIIVGAQSDASQGNLNALAPVLGPIVLGLLGAGGDDSPVGGIPLPDLPLDQLNPILLPTATVAAQILATPLLPNGTTAVDVVFPLVLGGTAGAADAALPLGTVSDILVGVMP